MCHNFEVALPAHHGRFQINVLQIARSDALP